MSTRPIAINAAPPTTNGRPPQRSTMGPKNGAAAAPTSEPSETPREISVLLQPNSRSNSGMNTPSTGLKNATSVKDASTATATTVQPRKKRGLVAVATPVEVKPLP